MINAPSYATVACVQRTFSALLLSRLLLMRPKVDSFSGSKATSDLPTDVRLDNSVATLITSYANATARALYIFKNYVHLDSTVSFLRILFPTGSCQRIRR